MRIEYIDKLKGFAILIVVMGHVIEKSMDIVDSPFVYLYTSFHMPLFMFLSGMFALKEIGESNLKETGIMILKKTKRIIVPFIFWGVLYTSLFSKDPFAIFSASVTNFWFLPALFYCMLIVYVINYIVSIFLKRNSRLHRYSIWALMGGGFMANFAIAYLYMKGLDFPYFLRFIKNFPFFAMGIAFAHSNCIKGLVLKNEITYALCVICYCAFLYLGYPPIITGAFAIVIIVNLFNLYVEKIPNVLSQLGKFTLEIYVLHWFFLPKMPQLGKYIDQIYYSTHNFNLTLLIIVSLVLAAAVIMLCCLAFNIIKRNLYLKKITGF